MRNPTEDETRVLGPDAFDALRSAGYVVAQRPERVAGALNEDGLPTLVNVWTTVLKHREARAIGRLYERLVGERFAGVVAALRAVRDDPTTIRALDAVWMVGGPEALRASVESLLRRPSRRA